MDKSATAKRRAPVTPRSHHVSKASPRVGLRLRAYETLRRHVLRSIGRYSVLIAGDVGTLFVLTGVLSLLRAQAVLGGSVAAFLGRALPAGYLGDWRYAVALFVGLLAAGNYGQGDHRRDPVRLALGVTLASALTLWNFVWTVGVPWVAFRFLITTGSVWLGLIGTRRVIDWVVSRHRRRTGQSERALFVGDPRDPRARHLHGRLVADGMVSLGWVSNGTGDAEHRISNPEDIWFILQSTEADTVVLTGQLSESLVHSVVGAAAAAGCRTMVVPRFDEVGHLRSSVVRHHALSFIELSVPGLSMHHLILKRLLDLIGSALLLVLLWPVFLIVAIAIKVDSQGPAFFTQERVGLGGRLFRVFKFRTMREGADDEKEGLAHLNRTGDRRLFKIPDDPRVTAFGAWLRRWSLDELPQLFNVFLGTMSLVGPRPFPDSDLVDYKDHHFLRLSVKPGITGLWQVKGRSDIVNFEEVVRLDREYIEHSSLWLDFLILMRTLPTVLRRTGAY